MKYDPSKRKPDEKMKPVISGNAKVKKKSGLEKAGSAFLEEDIRSAFDYMKTNVVIPGAKNLLYNMVMSALGTSLFGQNGAPRVNNGFFGGNSTGVNAGRVSYNSISNNTPASQNYRASVSNGFDYDKITYATAGDAQLVLDAMQDSLDRGYIVSVNDLFDLSNVSTNNSMVTRYGWEDLRTSKVVRTVDGWGILLPKPIPLN